MQASCHCGAVRLEISGRPESLTDCNCSICRRYATLWAYFPSSAVQVTAEASALDRYSWGEEHLAFVRCATCGCVMFWEPTEKSAEHVRMGINTRMVDPGEIRDVPIRKLDRSNC